MSNAPLRQLLYVSRLSDSSHVTQVPRILSTSRVQNAVYGITGVLVFDGERFCQFLEGPVSHVDQLVHNLINDPRHTQFHVLFDNPASERVFETFRMGYVALVDDVDWVVGLSQLVGSEALAKFMDTVAGMDIEA